MRTRTPISELLLRKIAVAPSGCWEWTGKRQTGPCPYGHQRLRKRTYLAHRLSWEIANGPIPAGMVICHACDNPPCINPAHLFIGSRSDNQNDMYKKSRWAWNKALRTGAANHQAKLNDGKALAIFNDQRTQEQIAKEYGIAQTTVSKIKNRQSWKHIHEKVAG